MGYSPERRGEFAINPPSDDLVESSPGRVCHNEREWSEPSRARKVRQRAQREFVAIGGLGEACWSACTLKGAGLAADKFNSFAPLTSFELASDELFRTAVLNNYKSTQGNSNDPAT